MNVLVIVLLLIYLGIFITGVVLEFKNSPVVSILLSIFLILSIITGLKIFML